MKIIALILALFSTNLVASQWIVHGFRDNFLDVGIWGGQFQVTEYWVDLYWDYAWDIAVPSSADSGLYKSQNWSGVTIGYQDTWTVDMPGPDAGFVLWAWISGGYPDYGGGLDLRYPPPDFNEVRMTPGEYWFDFAQNGVGRITIGPNPPTDFGKWAWDGSINPSWVAAKKGYAKGHNKPPLPSPK